MNAKVAAAFGLAAPLLYGGAVILGGALWPHYSHLSDPISLLASAAAPDTVLMNALFAVYDIVLGLFGLLWWFVRRDAARAEQIAALAVAVVGFLGIVMAFFRQDAPGTPVSAAGTVHIALAAAMSLLTMLAIFLLGRADGRLPRRRGAALYSNITLAAVFVSGGLAAVSIAQHWSFGGVFERCTIELFQLWVYVLAGRLTNRRGLSG